MPPNIIVDAVNDFNDAVDTFYNAFDELGKRILKSVAIYLNLEADFFESKAGQWKFGIALFTLSTSYWRY